MIRNISSSNQIVLNTNKPSATKSEIISSHKELIGNDSLKSVKLNKGKLPAGKVILSENDIRHEKIKDAITSPRTIMMGLGAGAATALFLKAGGSAPFVTEAAAVATGITISVIGGAVMADKSQNNNLPVDDQWKAFKKGVSSPGGIFATTVAGVGLATFVAAGNNIPASLIVKAGLFGAAATAGIVGLVNAEQAKLDYKKQ